MLYDFFIKRTYRGERKFHKLKKSWPFKNRATFYVLRFIYDSMKETKEWEKRFVLFFENCTTDEYEKCFSKLEKTINQYFEIVYRAWETNPNGDNYNAYLQNSSTLKEIAKKNVKKMETLGKDTQKILTIFMH